VSFIRRKVEIPRPKVGILDASASPASASLPAGDPSFKGLEGISIRRERLCVRRGGGYYLRKCVANVPQASMEARETLSQKLDQGLKVTRFCRTRDYNSNGCIAETAFFLWDIQVGRRLDARLRLS
jgi:hypothetical protein